MVLMFLSLLCCIVCWKIPKLNSTGSSVKQEWVLDNREVKKLNNIPLCETQPGKIWVVNMNLWKMVTPIKYSPLNNIQLWKMFTLDNIHPWKILIPEKYSPLKDIYPWKIFTPEKYSPLKNIHYPPYWCPPCPCPPVDGPNQLICIFDIYLLSWWWQALWLYRWLLLHPPSLWGSVCQ